MYVVNITKKMITYPVFKMSICDLHRVNLVAIPCKVIFCCWQGSPPAWWVYIDPRFFNDRTAYFEPGVTLWNAGQSSELECFGQYPSRSNMLCNGWRMNIFYFMQRFTHRLTPFSCNV